MKYDMKPGLWLLPLMLSVLMVGCAGIGTTSPEFSTQNAARAQSQFTGSFAIHGVATDKETYINIGANLSPGKGKRSTASGNKLIFLLDQPTGLLFGDFCVNQVAGLEVKQMGKKISFVLSFQDGSGLNGKGVIAADGSVSGSYTNFGPCPWTGGPGTFTAGKVAPLAGTYAGTENELFAGATWDTVTMTLNEAADGSLTVTGTSQLIGAFNMKGFVAGDIFLIDGPLTGSLPPVYGICVPASATSPAFINLVGPGGNIEGFIGTLFLE